MAPLVDTHCHLSLEQYEADLEPVLDRARQAGVQSVVVPGIDLPTSRRAVELAAGVPGVFAAVGVHPNEATGWSSAWLDELRQLAGSELVVAIGEVGLDYYRDRTPRAVQQTAFQAQLELAAELELPVIVHLRESAQDVVSQLVAWAARVAPSLAGRTGVLHAFSGDPAQAGRAVEAGFYLGVAGPITFPNADARREITAGLPAHRLLVETDSPFLTPHPHRGARNEPAHVRLVADALAQLRGETLTALAERTTSNAARLFGWSNGNDNRHIL